MSYWQQRKPEDEEANRRFGLVLFFIGIICLLIWDYWRKHGY